METVVSALSSRGFVVGHNQPTVGTRAFRGVFLAAIELKVKKAV